jgi:hypothetical protein
MAVEEEEEEEEKEDFVARVRARAACTAGPRVEEEGLEATCASSRSEWGGIGVGVATGSALKGMGAAAPLRRQPPLGSRESAEAMTRVAQSHLLLTRGSEA